MSFIVTYTGKRVDFLNPDPESVDIIDIAVGLARASRFAGQSLTRYSVAQHSACCAEFVSFDLRLAALLHDATEAYICDVPKPVKQLSPDYCEVERRLWSAIAERFDLPEELPAEIKDIDLRMLATEKKWLMPDHSDPWPVLEAVHPLPMVIARNSVWDEQTAVLEFIKRFENYSREKAAA